ncbi:hypothetical protein L1987_24198 [Smallanthus sonchifolius]|uniref:Uncharacterized protein n=1 Tax=Smallanthus sonchifolius TaxID=185202 RepID=A0ACB9IJZ7_9ASTR|nr:hypothetical protein L1987_24198 [Smallanthus sonchifolius]
MSRVEPEWDARPPNALWRNPDAHLFALSRSTFTWCASAHDPDAHRFAWSGLAFDRYVAERGSDALPLEALLRVVPTRVDKRGTKALQSVRSGLSSNCVVLTLVNSRVNMSTSGRVLGRALQCDLDAHRFARSGLWTCFRPIRCCAPSRHASVKVVWTRFLCAAKCGLNESWETLPLDAL